MSTEFGPWIIWVQGPAPIGPGYMVEAEMGDVGSSDFIGPIPAQDYDWDMPDDPIARYRVQKPNGMASLERIAAHPELVSA